MTQGTLFDTTPAWTATGESLRRIWTHTVSGYRVRHCGHPTAHHPYFIEDAGGGCPVASCFRLLKDAKAWVESHAGKD
jgi:hypothetical protein